MHRPAPRRRRLRTAVVAGGAVVVAGVGLAVAPTVVGASGPETASAVVGAAGPETASGTATGTGPNGQTIQVSPTTDLDPSGETVTVIGAGFDAAAGFDVATEGLYVAFCVDNGPNQTPTPCVGGVDMSGGSGASRWVTNNPIPGSPAVPISADGSFSTTIEVARADESTDCAALAGGKQCKVTVRMDHRQGGDRSQDVKVPVTFGAPVSDPELTVTPASGLDPAGATVTVAGTGYPTDAPGLYVIYGPQPSGAWSATPYGAAVLVRDEDVGPDGSWSVQLSGVKAAFTDSGGIARDFVDGGGFVSTFRAEGQPDPAGAWQDSVPVSFAGATVPVSTTTLAVAPTSIEAGRAFVMTATVTAGGAPVTAGTVEFRSGGTSLGTATLGVDGKATRTALFPSAGSRVVTAHFAGGDQALASTSAPVTVTVTASGSDPDPDPDPDPPSTQPSGTGTGTGRAGQTLTATPVENLDPNGTDVLVEGKGFTHAAGFDIQDEGLYLSFCVDNGDGGQPTPCVGGVDTEGSSGSSQWVTNNPYPGVPDDAVTPVASDGSFSATINVKAADEFVDCLDLAGGKRCVIVARMDHRATADRSQDVKVQVCFAGEPQCEVAPQTVDPTPDDDAFTGYPVAPTGTGPGTGGTGYGTSQLARTGFEARNLVGTGLALVAAGLALVTWARRRAALVPVPVPVPIEVDR